MLGKQRPETYNLVIRQHILEPRGVNSINSFDTTLNTSSHRVVFTARWTLSGINSHKRDVMALNLETLGLSATVIASGISTPDYRNILSTITEYLQQIYGTDAYLKPESKDGQVVALFALVIPDTNNTAIQVYNSFSHPLA